MAPQLRVHRRARALGHPRGKIYGVVDFGDTPGAQGWDFFVSYTGADRAWAEWVAWQLEDAGYRVLIQAWDFVAGSNWQGRMDEGVQHAERTIAVLSAAYLESVYGRQEWQAAQGRDPNGFARKVLPIRIEDCARPGLLGTVVSIDLFGRTADDAQRHLLDQVRGTVTGRAKPTSAPPFPTAIHSASPDREPAFPASDPVVSLPADPRPIGLPLSGHTSAVLSVTCAVSGKTLATASADGTARLWDVTDPMRPRPYRPALTGHTRAVNSVAFSPDGHTVATASDDKLVRLWDISEPVRPRAAGKLIGHTDEVKSVMFSPDGRTLASASWDDTVRLWDVSDLTEPQPIGDVLARHMGDVNAVTFSPDGHTLATAGDDRTVRLWNVIDPTWPRPYRRPLDGHPGYVMAVAFSPNSHLLATASSGMVQLWDVTDPAKPKPFDDPLTEYPSSVRSVAFSPNGRYLVTASLEDVWLWDVTEPAKPQQIGEPLSEHTSRVNSVVFSPDGRTLFTASDDQTVQLWRIC